MCFASENMELVITLKNKVETGVNKAMPDIRQLLRLNINEQTISCLISKSLSNFSTGDISIDPEYDRHLDKQKTMVLGEYVRGYRENPDEQGFDCLCRYCKKIKSGKEFRDTKKAKRPDIVIHERNSDDKNNIVIEIKKYKKCLWDYLKLRYMTDPKGPYKYKLGIFIYFSCDEPKYIFFVNGAEKIL